MLDKIKAVHKIKKMQSDIQSQLKEIYHEEEKGTMKVLVRGDKYIESFELNGEERKDIKDLINDAIKKVDKKTEKRMRGQAGDLMSMFGI